MGLQEFYSLRECVWRGFIILSIFSKVPQDPQNVNKLLLSQFSAAAWNLFHVEFALA